jgi:Rix1 complex component involved in 60S ribosome maturation
MPFQRSAKVARRSKKNPNQNVDFKKVKKTLGKRQRPSNATKTEFKTRAIIMPNQSMLSVERVQREKEKQMIDDNCEDGKDDEDDDDEDNVALDVRLALTKRRLSTDDLLVQTKHYAPKVRRAALEGLFELLTTYGLRLFLPRLSALFDRLLPLLIDTNPTVRKPLLDFFERLFSLTSARGERGLDMLRPFAPVCVAYVSATLTHGAWSVKREGLAFCRLLFGAMPALFAPHYAGALCEHFCALLGVDGSAATTRTEASSAAAGDAESKRNSAASASTESIVDVLGTLQLFLAGLARHRLGAIDVDGQQSTRAVEWRAEHRVAVPFAWLGRAAAAPLDLRSGRDALASLPSPSSSSPDVALADDAFALHDSLVDRLVCVPLMRFWLELSPSEALRSPDTLSRMHLLLDIVNWLIAEHLSPSASASIAQRPVGRLLVRHLSAHFPFEESPSTPAPARAQLLANNLLMCEILCRCIGGNDNDNVSDSGSDDDDDRGQHGSIEWSERMTFFLAARIRAIANKASGGKKAKSGSVDLDQAKRLLDVACALLRSNANDDAKKSLLRAVFDLHSRAARRSEACQLALRSLLDMWRAGLLDGDAELVRAWIGSLPRMLWQLGAERPDSTSCALEALSLVGARHREFVEPLQNALVPLFYTSIASKGREVFGPFVQLPDAQQRQMVELLFNFDEPLALPLLRAVGVCCSRGHAVSVDTARYACELIALRCTEAQPPRQSPSDALSLLLSVMRGCARGHIDSVKQLRRKRARQRGDDDDDDDDDDVYTPPLENALAERCARIVDALMPVARPLFKSRRELCEVVCSVLFGDDVGDDHCAQLASLDVLVCVGATLSGADRPLPEPAKSRLLAAIGGYCVALPYRIETHVATLMRSDPALLAAALGHAVDSRCVASSASVLLRDRIHLVHVCTELANRVPAQSFRSAPAALDSAQRLVAVMRAWRDRKSNIESYPRAELLTELIVSLELKCGASEAE